MCVQLTGSPIVEDKTSDLQIAGKRCIHYASQDGPIHSQSETGFMRLYRRYKRKKKYDLQKGGWKKYGRISGASLTNLIITGSYASGIV